MPESKSRKTGNKAAKAAKADRAQLRAERRAQEQEPGPLPTWYKAIMFGLMIVGLIWIVVYYLTMGVAPIPQAGGWNIGIGFGIACVGFLMTTRWR
ncbi:cell division protein CrgA [Citricoccus nitrophenolicus]|uniref:Cell division protein CrgA n=1 Tax=Citricoccus nitrophenolicus TaxID=863575 RepID=A0ABV0IG16_9MICC|nr:cell division protein CrgA [Citricoccus sp. I39-566]WMY78857.1 cell division protein CrgA [Citricoccus sp. I39-566]